MKISQSFLDSKNGSKFWWLRTLFSSPKQHLCKDMQHSVCILLVRICYGIPLWKKIFASTYVLQKLQQDFFALVTSLKIFQRLRFCKSDQS